MAKVTGVRLVHGDGPCSGTPEVFTEGKWRRLNPLHFNDETGMIICKELKCGYKTTIQRNAPLNVTIISGSMVVCRGPESALSQCTFNSTSTFVDLNFVLHCTGELFYFLQS